MINREVKPECKSCDFKDEIINNGMAMPFCILFRKYIKEECFLLTEEVTVRAEKDFHKDQLNFFGA